MVDIIHEGFDCVIRVGELNDSGLIARKIGTYTLINCASLGYLSCFVVPTRLEALSSHAMVHYTQQLSRRPGLNILTASSAITADRRRRHGQQHRNLPRSLPSQAGHYSGAGDGHLSAAGSRLAGGGAARFPGEADADFAALSPSAQRGAPRARIYGVAESGATGVGHLSGYNCFFMLSRMTTVYDGQTEKFH